jgi:hypothetical protein
VGIVWLIYTFGEYLRRWNFKAEIWKRYQNDM